jgi:hypothetical protein
LLHRHGALQRPNTARHILRPARSRYLLCHGDAQRRVIERFVPNICIEQSGRKHRMERLAACNIANNEF